MVLRKQLRFGHKSALKAYVSSEQLQNVSKCVCVCDVFYFSGAWNIYLAGFCSNPPFPLGPCPKMVVYNAGPATTIQKFTALLSASRTIQSNPSTRDRTLPSTDGVQRHHLWKHKAYHRRKGGNFEKSLLKNQSLA